MKDFYKTALAAAKISPQALARTFKKKEANANIKGGYCVRPLIHSIIREISDTTLPDLLSILIQHDVDLESEDESAYKRTPLGIAARHQKKNAVYFLINNSASMQHALCDAITSDFRNDSTLDIVKILVEHGADINVQDKFSMTPLMYAAGRGELQIIRYLLSQGANLFLKYTEDVFGMTTALGIGYGPYYHYRHGNNADSQNAKICFDLLLQKTADYLYHQGLQERNEELFIDNSILDLAGKFRSLSYPEYNSDALKKLLEENIKPSVLARIRAERMHAFCIGSEWSKAQQESGANPPHVYRFFQHDGKKDISREIFSYLHTAKKS